MKTITGPTYRYQGERLLAPEVILVQDHHYDAEHGYALQRLLDASVCPADQHLLVFDHVLRQDEFARYRHVCLPLLLAAECKEFNQESLQPGWQKKSHAFNFMINKPRTNRIILMDLIHDLDLTNFRHSLCWSMPYKSIPVTNYRFGDEKSLERGLRNGNYRNATTYHYLLKDNVFEPTAVSLITEPAFYERETIVTEKTLMAIWAGTLPIWVGGWRCADSMRDLGFDVFDDTIDHGYQDLDDPAERCVQAIKRNLHVLRNPIDMEPYRSRLERNLNLLRQNVFLDRVNDQLRLHPSLTCIRDQFRNGLLVPC